MPHKQSHRGAHPKDEGLFNTSWVQKLAVAAKDINELISKGYPEKGSINLVSNHFRFNQRQRKALMRVCLSDQRLEAIQKNEVALEEISGQEIYIDGFNLLISIEAALSGGFIFEGREGCYRDIASVHASYRKVEETREAFSLIGKFLDRYSTSTVHWLLDSPVSNSGRLSKFALELAETEGFNWSFGLVFDPDRELIKKKEILISSDTVILENCRQWTNLAKPLIDECIPDARVLRFYS